MPGPDQNVSPATARVTVTVPPVTISIRPNLSNDWTEIALRAEAGAIAARRAGLASVERGEGQGGFSADETYESMVAVVAARYALTHLEKDWKELGYFDKGDQNNIPLLATVNPPEDVEGWLAAIHQLIIDRGRIVHEPQKSSPAEPHPVYPSNVSSIAATYTVARATDAVDLLLDFWHRVIDSPSRRMEKWASDRTHVPAALDKSRADKKQTEAG